MTQDNGAADGVTCWIRRIARLWSLVVIAFALFMFAGEIIFPHTEPGSYPWVEALMPLSMMISILGLAVAFRWELIGAIINISFFLLNLILYGVINGRFFPLSALAFLSLAVVPGILFLISHQRGVQQRPPTGHEPSSG